MYCVYVCVYVCVCVCVCVCGSAQQKSLWTVEARKVPQACRSMNPYKNALRFGNAEFGFLFSLLLLDIFLNFTACELGCAWELPVVEFAHHCRLEEPFLFRTTSSHI
jgi:hypothetical protein